MMPNITRGDRFAGLLTYLVGDGRANEHTEPHLVAGDTALLQWHSDDELSRDAGLAIARHLERPHKAYGNEVPGGHVWHCSLSLRADEGQLTDQRWQEIADDFVRAMGFADPDDGKAPCRWAAVRHGVSKNGNDHIHIVVNLVREDGTRASTWNDYRRAQAASRALEVKYGLEELESVRAERATRGYNPAERQAQARGRARAKHERTRLKNKNGAPAWEQLSGEERQQRIASELRTDQPRYLLALKVRAAAGASADEGEFVRRARRSGLLVRPRYAAGTTDVVVGYSVAERPEAGERPIWYGGGHLGRDLALPRLREGWSDTPAGASGAVAEWSAAQRGRRPVAPGRETREPDPSAWERQNADLRELVQQLRDVPLDDRETWTRVARHSAGALAAWSVATEAEPGDLAAAAEALSRSAQTFQRPVRPQKTDLVALSGAAMLLSSAVRGGQGTLAQTVMMRQLLRLTQAVHDVAVAERQTRYAHLLATDTRARLVRLREALPASSPAALPGSTPATAGSAGQTITAPAAVDTARTPSSAPRPVLDPEAQAMLERMHAGQARPATEATSPIPAKLPTEPQKPRTRTSTDRGSEPER